MNAITTDRSLRLALAADKAIATQLEAGELKAAGKLRWTADDDDCPDVMRLAALMEETGEVARFVHDGNPAELAVELAQLAGVALAWLIVIDPAT